MKKYYLNLFDNTRDNLHTFTFTEQDIQECKKSRFWNMSVDELGDYIVPKLLKSKNVKRYKTEILSFVANRRTFLDEKYNYKKYNCFTAFIEPDVIELLEPAIARDQKHSIEISCQILTIVL